MGAQCAAERLGGCGEEDVQRAHNLWHHTAFTHEFSEWTGKAWQPLPKPWETNYQCNKHCVHEPEKQVKCRGYCMARYESMQQILASKPKVLPVHVEPGPIKPPPQWNGFGNEEDEELPAPKP